MRNQENLLFEGEKLQLSINDDWLIGIHDDDIINQKYIKGDVRIVTEQARYPLTAIKGMLESGNYERNPDYQRRHRWNRTQKSLLIESFIMNVPIPPIFLYESRFSHYEVMDGLQRLTAIYDFYSNKFPLEGLELWPELNGKLYDQLPDQIKKGIDRRYLSSIILLQETAKNESEALKLKQLVFERINSGGVKLEPQESRNAIYAGPFNSLCIRLSRNYYLCKTWNIPAPDEQEIDSNGEILSKDLLDNNLFKEMADVELVLRFFANRQRSLYSFKTLRLYLDMYLLNANYFDNKLMTNLELVFTNTIKLAFELFEEKAFWMYRKRNDSWNWYPHGTIAIYDPLMYVLSQKIGISEHLIHNKYSIQEGIVEFYKINYDDFEGRATNPSVIQKRYDLFLDFFQKYDNE